MKVRFKSLGSICLFTALFLVFAAVAMASSGEAVQKHWTTNDWIRVMNFSVLVIALFFVSKKPVADALNGRIEDIKNQLEELEGKKTDAEKTLAEYEKKIATLEDEVAVIETQYKEQGESAKQRILEAAKNSAEKLEAQAKRNIENEFQQAKQELQAEIMTKALETAEEIVKKSISDKDQDRLVDEYLEKGVA